MYYALICGFSAASAVLLTVMGFKIMQILQLSSYRVRGLFEWLKSTKADYVIRYFSVAFFSVVCMLVYTGCFGAVKYAAVRYLGLLFYFLSIVIFVCVTAKQKKKTPLKITRRIVRLSILSAIIFCGASFGLFMLGERTLLKNNIRYSLVGLLPMFVPLIILLAYYILFPFETLNNLHYEVKARKKLANNKELIKIGITGSYGKTTAKNILAAMLEEKFHVLYSPASYNTPLGIAKVVNNELKEEHNVFIAEMGARYKGDIARLTKLVAPSMGIITAVGRQHLATFGSEEAIRATKYELVEGLPENGTAFFSADNEGAKQMFERTHVEKVLAGGAEHEGVSVSYSDVEFGRFGTAFTLSHCGQSERAVTKLLGRHIPSVVSLCAAVALKLGVSLGKIVSAVEKLQPVEHRLQLIQNGDVTVIDDAYNSNTEGAKNALEVLKAFDGTRIVITPGLVEMGDGEEEANKVLGGEVFGCADYAFFVGSRAAALKSGALNAGMSEEKIEVCLSLDEAVKKSSEIAGKKTILFENDLPDNLN